MIIDIILLIIFTSLLHAASISKIEINAKVIKEWGELEAALQQHCCLVGWREQEEVTTVQHHVNGTISGSMHFTLIDAFSITNSNCQDTEFSDTGLLSAKEDVRQLRYLMLSKIAEISYVSNILFLLRQGHRNLILLLFRCVSNRARRKLQKPPVRLWWWWAIQLASWKISYEKLKAM